MSLTSHWLTSLPKFFNKIKKIKNIFVPSGTENDVHPPSDPPEITQVSKDAVDKIIRNSQTPACWILGQHFSSRNVVIFYCHHLQNWLTAHSWWDVSLVVPKLLWFFLFCCIWPQFHIKTG